VAAWAVRAETMRDAIDLVEHLTDVRMASREPRQLAVAKGTLAWEEQYAIESR
jgi:hypothetical protein